VLSVLYCKETLSRARPREGKRPESYDCDRKKAGFQGR